MQRVVVLVAFVALLSGCWRTDPVYVDVPAPTHLAALVAPECPRDGAGFVADLPEGTEGAIPSSFTAVRVLQCVSVSSDAAGRTRIKQTTSAVTEQLITALRLPDQRMERQGYPPVACPAAMFGPTLLMLVDDQDRAIIVRRPLGDCGNPRREVEAAVKALKVDTVMTYIVQRKP